MKAIEALKQYEAWMIRERLAPLTRESYYGWAERFCAFKDPAKSTTAEDRISNFLGFLLLLFWRSNLWFVVVFHGVTGIALNDEALVSIPHSMN